MTILHPAVCPKCGWPSHADQRGKMLCCEGIRENEVHEDIKIKGRRWTRRGTPKTEHSGAGNEGGGNALLTTSAGQLKLF